MGKTMCKEKKKIMKKHDGKPNYICKKCGEEAVKEKHLCKPREK